MSTPRINPNDPKWTAYVLGELESDRDAVEQLLESSPEARALVADLKTACATIEEAVDAEPSPVLSPAQRAAIRRAADAATPGLLARLPMQWAWAMGAVAAVAIIAFVMLKPTAPQQQHVLAARTITPPSSTAAPLVESPGIERSTPTAPQPGRREEQQATSPTPPATIQSGASTANASAQTVAEPSAAPPTRLDTPPAESRVDATSTATKDSAASVGSVAETIVVTGEKPKAGVQSPRQAAPVATLRGFVSGGAAGVYLPGTIGRVPAPTRNTESYASVSENTYMRASQEPLATFSIDVDTASYSNVRRFLNQNQLPPADAVRIEELVNYFTYDYSRPSGAHPIGTSITATAAPWNPQHRLVRIGVKAREVDAARRPPSNLVFLIDVSGSMNMPQKLPLVKSSLKLLVDQLGENDIISIVVYAGSSGLVLPPTSGDRKDVIARAIDGLEAGGSTNGGAGIELAYRQATGGFIRGGVNRVILMTDGDFNVGITSQGELTRLIEERAKSGVFLSVLGFGMGNLKDSTMERLADMGNGHYAYIDTLGEARKVLVEQMSGTLVTVAKDVKIQVDFNPAKVEAYRLIGYENRVLRPEDFNDDRKDAGDMGAGHTVTALFEIIPAGGSVPGSIDPSVFQAAPRTPPPAAASKSNDMLVLRVRYKQPDASESTRMDVPFADRGVSFANADPDFRFAASVAAFGMILKQSPNRGSATLDWVLDTATASRGKDRGGYRDEFVSLVQKALALSNRTEPLDVLPRR